MTKLHCGVTQDVFDMWVDRVATRIDADILDRIEPQLNDIGWHKERTCTMTYDEEWSGDELYPTQAFICSECGGMTVEGVPNYCPNCGARVRSEE